MISKIINRILSYIAIGIGKILSNQVINSSHTSKIDVLHKISNQIGNTIETDGIIFYCPNPTSLKRFKVYRRREKDIFFWMDNFIGENEIFFDIGACIGEMSLYAAIKKNAEVYAFEPSSLNYSILYQNIYLNNLDKKISALNIALTDRNHISSLIYNKERFIAGKSNHHFSEINSSFENSKKAEFRQTAIGYSLDTLVKNFSLPRPNHIKIDVDGNDHNVILGSEEILSSVELKTIACEFNQKIHEHHEMLKTIEKFGFKKIKSIPDDKQSQERETQNVFYIKS